MSEHKTCGRCKHWHSLTGKALGKCDKKEIDFVATKKDETRYFQVTESLADDNTKDREIAPFYLTDDFYEKTIITMDKTYITNFNGIKLVNLIDFLLS